jgi:hypothetical protein
MASFAGSTEGSGKSRGLVRRALAFRAVSPDAKGSGARSRRPLSVGLLAGLALLLSFAFGASVVRAAVPTVTIEPAEVGVTGAKVKGTVNPGGKYTIYRFQYVSDADFQALDAQQRLTVIATGGTYSLSFKGQTTAPIAYDASPAALQSALEALSTLAVGDVAVSGGPGSESGSTPYILDFGGALAGASVEQLNIDSSGLTGAFTMGTVETTIDGHPEGFGLAQSSSGVVLGSKSTTPVEATLPAEGIFSPNTTYHLRLIARNADNGPDPASTIAAVAPNFTTSPGTAPTLALNPASSVSYQSAHLSGTVDPEGGNVNPGSDPLPIQWDLQYSHDPVNEGWSSAGSGKISNAAATGTSPIAVAADAVLQQNTSYVFRLVASYANDLVAQTPEPYPGFTTLVMGEAPTVLSVANASNELNTTAKVSGEVERPANPNSAFDASCRFEYVTDAQFLIDTFASASQAACVPNPVTVPGPNAVTANLNGLAFSTTYHFRLTASNAVGSDSKVAASTFTTLPAPAAPTASIATPTGVTGRTAHFSGQINPGGVDNSRRVDWHFECTPECPGLAGGTIDPDNASHTVEADAKDLEPNTAYQVKLVAANSAAEVTAGPASFPTLALAPEVTTGSASVLSNAATIAGQINPAGLGTTYFFKYGPTAGYGQSTPTQSLPATDAQESVSASLEELEPGTTYHFRLVATNSAGTVEGADKTFTTQAVPGGESCPNSTVRIQQKTTWLPDCRAWEIVTPPALDVGSVDRVIAVGDDGEHVLWVNIAAFDAAKAAGLTAYAVAERGPGGWTSTNAHYPIDHPIPSNTLFGILYGMSADGTRTLNNSSGPGNADDQDSVGDLYRYTVGADSSEWLSNKYLGNNDFVPEVPAASADFERVVFEVANLPTQVMNGTTLENPFVLPDGTPVNGEIAGNAHQRGLNSDYNIQNFDTFIEHGGQRAISDDGNRLFFYATGGLYVREGLGASGVTVPVSASQRIGSVGEVKPARFVSASHDGRLVFFVSNSQLTDAATPGGGIYRFDVATKDLTLLTPDAGSPDGLQFRTPDNVVVSDDSSHVYFTSPRALLPGAHEGAYNVYVSSGGTTRLVASSPSLALERVSRNGRFAVLLSTESIDGARNNGFRAVYEYDDVTEDVACASCRTDGSLSQGNAYLNEQNVSTFNGAVTHPRNIADDGRLFFDSLDQLTEQDQSEALDVYEYYKGKISLISGGTGDEGSFLMDNSDDGSHVFFTSRMPLVATDGDPQEFDVYDAHAGGGFLLPPPPAAGCEGEACRGARSSAPSAVAPVTPSFIGAGNKQSGRNQGKKHHKKKHHKKKHHKKGKQGKKGNAHRNGRTGR